MKIILCGACGRMGGMIGAVAAERGDTIVFGVDLVQKPAPYPIAADCSEAPEADVLIDFSSPDGIADRLRFAADRGLPVLLGTTGFSEEALACIREFSARIPIFHSGNYSIGINLLERLVREAARILEGFDAEIIERHHNQKKDAPSGTALMLASSIEQASAQEKERVYSRHGMVGPRDPREIGIHSVRGGNLIGEHEVMFAGEDEVVTLAHSARSRRVFATGALRAAHWLIGRAPGLYKMDDFLSDLTV